VKVSSEWTVQPGGYRPVARWADRALRPLRALGGLRLTPEALSRAADRQARMPDLRPDEVSEPLHLLCADLAEHPPTALGALTVRTSVVQALASRRRLQHTTAPARPQRPPIVLVGWYRTGTTFLQELLAALPGYGPPPMHRLVEPVARRGSVARATLGVRVVDQLVPELSVIHPVTAHSAEECWLLLATHLLVDGMSFHWKVPRLTEWLRRTNRETAYRGWAFATALLERDLGHALVLKDPAHMLGLPALLAAVPDARLIWTHRDPAKCIASFGSLTAVQHRAIYGRVDADRAGKVLLEQMRHYFEVANAGREAIGAHQLVDIPSSRLRADPVGAVRTLCEQMDLPFDASLVAERAAALGARPRSTHRYDLSQWGLTREQVYAAVGDVVPDLWKSAVRG
jgi:hypothetical protein